MCLYNVNNQTTGGHWPHFRFQNKLIFFSPPFIWTLDLVPSTWNSNFNLTQ